MDKTGIKVRLSDLVDRVALSAKTKLVLNQLHNPGIWVSNELRSSFDGIGSQAVVVLDTTHQDTVDIGDSSAIDPDITANDPEDAGGGNSSGFQFQWT
jgi:hypothetical protein